MQIICGNKKLSQELNCYDMTLPPSHLLSFTSFQQITLFKFHLFDRLGGLWSQVTQACLSPSLNSQASWKSCLNDHLHILLLTHSSPLLCSLLTFCWNSSCQVQGFPHNWKSNWHILSLVWMASLENRSCVDGPPLNLFFPPLVKPWLHSWICGCSFFISFRMLRPSALVFIRTLLSWALPLCFLR